METGNAFAIDPTISISDRDESEIDPLATTGEIQGSLWEDINGDGSQNASEPGLERWTVYLDDNRNGRLENGETATTTDINGDYRFSDLEPDRYYVGVVRPSGWEQTHPRTSNVNSIRSVPTQEPNKPDGTLEGAIERAAATQSDATDATKWAIGLEAGASPEAVAASLGAENMGAVRHQPNTFILDFPSTIDPRKVPATSNPSPSPGVEFLYPLTQRQQQTRAVSPRFLPNDSLFGDQWHLVNTGQTGGTVGVDANIELAWDLARGTGVVIAIVDNGLQPAHPDLSDRYRADLSFDFNDGDFDPSPIIGTARDYHGTAVAGVAAGNGNNNLGISGAAPNASIAGFRLVDAPTSDLDEANALSYKSQEIDIYNNSWGPTDDARRLEGPGPLTLAALENGTTNGRGGLGSIYLWSAGNGLEKNDNINYDGYANSRYTIAVGAIDHKGKQAFYSEPGAPMLVTAYSNGDGVGITTTDLLGDDGLSSGNYTSGFGGTSSSTPLVSGVVALMLEVNPNLTWRDVQHVLVETAEQNDIADLDWKTNGAGHLVNHKYGFGAVDALAAVEAATTWVTVAPEVSATSGEIAVKTTVPDNNPTGVSSTISIVEDINLEWVEIVFDATHAYRGDLEIVLTSPDGTESVLAQTHDDFKDDYNSWTFTSARHWGESSFGDWTLAVSDGVGGDIGLWNSWQLNFYGTAIDENLQTVTLNAGETSDNIDFGNQLSAIPEGTGGDDLLFGGSSNDSIFGLAGNDSIDGGAGDDDLWGNSGNDRLRGQVGSDTLRGGLGNDELRGGAGNDLLVGSFENDILEGEAGEDTLYGNSENDTLSGGEGNDFLRGSDGNDELYGESGDDTLNGGTEEDLLSGGEGNDILRGSDGNDELNGGSGNDRLVSGIGNDTLSGTDATATGLGEKDTLIGEEGADVFILGNAVQAYYNGGGSVDFARVVDLTQEDAIVLHGAPADYQLLEVNGNTQILLAGDIVGIAIGVTDLDLSDASTFNFV
ncbi:S8 family serine peptidase [Oscillatoriales cyanobacterium LEGE 11467]|uniref:S8 family serine peptidase n=1 Tax=Zarconia navalis LEGE 11467 TaxID=1828826 RepID=A0A928VW26_9CYAN|nr:S8 family serine peptidase [Zarconia navalis]MBE9041211.1 S8 family serine peptidase [Zarconia navalis LEGE 11467]